MSDLEQQKLKQQQRSGSAAVRALKFTPGYEDMEASPGYDKIVMISNSAPVSRKRIDKDEYEDPADAVPREAVATRSHLCGIKGNVVVPKS